MVKQEQNEKAAASPAARIVSEKSRSTVVPLEWPVDFDGKTYDSITVRRISGTELANFTLLTSKGENPPLPMIDCPREVYDALDADDMESVDKAVNDFMPRRWREAAGLTQDSGEAS